MQKKYNGQDVSNKLHIERQKHINGIPEHKSPYTTAQLTSHEIKANV
jgi:hypothetical protein